MLLSEFESADEFMSHYGIYRATISDLVKEVSRGFPVVATTFVRTYLSFLLEKMGGLPIASVQTEAYVEIDSFVLFLEGVCSSVMGSFSNTSGGECLQSAEVAVLADIAQLVLAWQPVAPLLVLNKMRFLSGLPSVLNLSAPFTSACFEYLFQMLSYDCDSIQDDSIDDQVMQVLMNLYVPSTSMPE